MKADEVAVGTLQIPINSYPGLISQSAFNQPCSGDPMGVGAHTDECLCVYVYFHACVYAHMYVYASVYALACPVGVGVSVQGVCTDMSICLSAQASWVCWYEGHR